MPFRLPTFNLVAHIHRYNQPPPAPPSVTADCQWRTVAKLTAFSTGVGTGNAVFPCTEILLPKGTDVRGVYDGVGNNFDSIYLQVTGGVLPFYVTFVYDVAKGFANEYRIATVQKIPGWPVPIP